MFLIRLSYMYLLGDPKILLFEVMYAICFRFNARIGIEVAKLSILIFTERLTLLAMLLNRVTKRNADSRAFRSLSQTANMHQ